MTIRGKYATFSRVVNVIKEIRFVAKNVKLTGCLRALLVRPKANI